jgi:hypothetical protein
VAQPKASLLPVPVGAWVDEGVSCSAAQSVWVFDGSRTGYVGFNPNLRSGNQLYGDMAAFTSVKPARGGYTEFRPDGFGEISRMLVKQEGGDRLTLIMRAPGREHIEELVDTFRLCPVATLSAKVQQALERFAPSLAGAAGDRAGQAQSLQNAPTWQVEAPPNGALALAYVEGPAAMNAVGLQCQQDGSIVLSAAAAGQRADRPLVVTFASQSSGANVDATLTYSPKARFFRGPASSILVGLIIEEARSLEFRLNTVPAGHISTIGSAKAIRTALAPCLGLGASAPSSELARTSITAPLGIATGFYVDEGTSCTDPISAFYYDGKRAGVIFETDGMPPDPIGRVKKEAGEYFLPNAAILVKVLGPTRVQLTIQDTGAPMRLCPAAQIPRSISRLVR